MISRPPIATRTTGLAHEVSSVVRTLRDGWSKSVSFAARPGAAWLIGSFLATDALVTVMMLGNGKQADSVLGAVAGFPFREQEWGGCGYQAWRNALVAVKDEADAWCITPAAALSNKQYLYEEGTVLIKVRRSTASSSGLWSPTISFRKGRTVEVLPVGLDLTEVEFTTLRSAVVSAWPAIVNSGMVAYAATPLDLREAQAISTGQSAELCSVHWGWAANDIFVLAGFTLLLASHSQRLERWRRANSPHRGLTNCPRCRYALAGLPSNETGDRTCPECGKVCGQFF